jgi:hypothetical protein
MQRPLAAAFAGPFLLVLACCATQPPLLQALGSHAYLAGDSMIVEMGTHLIVLDPPADERRAQSFLEAAKKRFPGKPLRYLVLTQRPMDRPERLRAYLDQRTEWIVPRGAGEDLRRALASPRTLIVEIADKYVLADGEREVDILPADGLRPGRLVGYVRELGGNAGRLLLLEHHLP